MSEYLSALLTEIVQAGKEQGQTQQQLVARAGLGAATLSRAKKADDIRYSTLEALAKTVGLRVALVPDTPMAEKIRKGALFQ